MEQITRGGVAGEVIRVGVDLAKRVEPRMKAMQEMHQKMMHAKTSEERNALMADHMKAMQRLGT